MIKEGKEIKVGMRLFYSGSYGHTNKGNVATVVSIRRDGVADLKWDNNDCTYKCWYFNTLKTCFDEYIPDDMS